MMWNKYILFIVIEDTLGFRYFQDRLPNGDQVPHPCKPNYLWRGVGHVSPMGGGDRNRFGQDFARYKQWTPELCRMDSDGDGLTNGHELGDPDCRWTQGSFPDRDKNITHPGVCDPWGSDKCREDNKQVTCDTGEFICDGINSPDVFNITLRFPETAVPAETTTYMCMTFDLDMLEQGVVYHMIATQPLTDNRDVMHHTDLYTCERGSEQKNEPQTCYMGEPGCTDFLSTWVLGLPGQCINKEAGFRIGRDTRLMVQHHWNNPEQRSDYRDSSGMILYLTRKLRRSDAGYFVTGQEHLDIPPGQSRVVQQSTCTSECTQTIIKKPIYIMTGLNHMHYLGYQQSVEHFRNGEKLHDLTRDDKYSYDSPVIHQYPNPLEVRPGDELLTTCVYRSVSKTKTTFYGDGTNDEMCFAFLTFYPLDHVTKQTCSTWMDIDMCKLNKGMLLGCNTGVFFNSSHHEHKALFSKVLDNCNVGGGCRMECPAAIAEALEHPCLKGNMRHLVENWSKYYEENESGFLKFFAALGSCDCPNEKVTSGIPMASKSPPSINTSFLFLKVVLVSLTVLFFSI